MAVSQKAPDSVSCDNTNASSPAATVLMSKVFLHAIHCHIRASINHLWRCHTRLISKHHTSSGCKGSVCLQIWLEFARSFLDDAGEETFDTCCVQGHSKSLPQRLSGVVGICPDQRCLQTSLTVSWWSCFLSSSSSSAATSPAVCKALCL